MTEPILSNEASINNPKELGTRTLPRFTVLGTKLCRGREKLLWSRPYPMDLFIWLLVPIL